ncbi:MAG TPA: xanthine dehydrogenase family protein molybdopterin-binding subunit, partial [Casimicrobiaceae bacterium]|nr:xanthine dehydrogenase family protein molybdopterin-binding subunit [Casimicrobiaceae bacterium]
MAGNAASPIGTGKLVGASVRRVEDRRALMGKSQFVDDLRLLGTLAIAFVRSPHAHAKILRVDASAARAHPGVHKVFIAEDLKGSAAAMRVEWEPTSRSPQHKTCEWPVLARGKARFVGEAVAAVVADDRYVAEDAAELVEVDYEPLDPVVDMERALESASPLVHDEWGDNILVAVKAEFGEVARAFAEADVVVSERFSTGRHTALPMEGRACLASYEPASEQLTFWSSSQIPHVLRTHLAQILDFPEHRLRVVAPDVGGGFGLKAHVFPEEIVTAYASRELGCPVKWIEDRRENLIASLHAKHQVVNTELALRNDGTILGMRSRCLSDIGAYTEHPWSSGLEAGVTASAMPGPYKIAAYGFEALSIATNKTTIGAYRGVGIPAAVFAMERTIDIAAHRLAIDPAELRRRNMIRREDHPYTNVLGFQIESGSHQESLAKALEMIGYEDFRAQQKTARDGGRLMGLGIASYVETTAPGTAGWLAMGLRMAGYETATVRMDRAGKVTVLVGTHSHGQSHETTFAQIAADQIGVALDDVRVVF